MESWRQKSYWNELRRKLGELEIVDTGTSFWVINRKQRKWSVVGRGVEISGHFLFVLMREIIPCLCSDRRETLEKVT